MKKLKRLLGVLLISVLVISSTLIQSVYAESLPDLKFSSINITSVTSTNVFYSYTITNGGTATLPAYCIVTISNQLSNSQNYDAPGSVNCGETSFPLYRSLAPGETYSGTFYSTGTAPGSMKYLLVRLDRQNFISESSEYNNKVALGLLPDLVFEDVTAVQKRGNQVLYVYTIRNNGPQTIPSMYNIGIHNYYSPNRFYGDAGDIDAGWFTIGLDRPLSPGESFTSFGVAEGYVPYGTYYLVGKVDYTNVVNEQLEGNNTFTKEIP